VLTTWSGTAVAEVDCLVVSTTVGLFVRLLYVSINSFLMMVFSMYFAIIVVFIITWAEEEGVPSSFLNR